MSTNQEKWEPNGDSKKSSDSDERDIVSLDALSEDELKYIVGISKYRGILLDLLSPFIEELSSETTSVHTADHTVTDDQSDKQLNTTVYRPSSRQGGGADLSSSVAKRGP